MKHFTKKEWEQMVKDHPDYTGRWEPSPFNLGRIAAGEIPAAPTFSRPANPLPPMP